MRYILLHIIHDTFHNLTMLGWYKLAITMPFTIFTYNPTTLLTESWRSSILEFLLVKWNRLVVSKESPFRDVEFVCEEARTSSFNHPFLHRHRQALLVWWWQLSCYHLWQQAILSYAAYTRWKIWEAFGCLCYPLWCAFLRPFYNNARQCSASLCLDCINDVGTFSWTEKSHLISPFEHLEDIVWHQIMTS